MENREEIIRHVREKKIIAILRNIETRDCPYVAEALLEGGIDMMEVTFDQSGKTDFARTADSIRLIRESLGSKVYAGAGTVMTMEQVELAYEAGAEYIITPNTNPEVIRCARHKGLVVMPGAMTPTDVACAYDAGADFVKIFPADTLGPAYIKAVRGPLPHIPLLAVGGVNEKNIKSFLDAGAVGAGVGGNLVSREWIRAGEYGKITQLAKEYVRSVNQGEKDV